MPAPSDQLVVLGRLLTRREREVLELVGARLSNQEIAERFTVSKRTVEHHVSALYAKLGVTSRSGLIIAARHIAAGAARTPPSSDARAAARATPAFTRAVRAELAAIAMHEASACRLEELAATLEAKTSLPYAERLRDRLDEIAATARRSADAARHRAAVARRRLHDEGVAVAMPMSLTDATR